MSSRAQVLRRVAAGNDGGRSRRCHRWCRRCPRERRHAPEPAPPGVVFCDKTNFVPTLVRQMTVTKHQRHLHDAQRHAAGDPGTEAVRVEPRTGKTLQIRTTQPGCFPSSISGYAISDNREDLLDNYGYYYTLDRL